jgi:NitT/TauT family transport system substrate-binding protein
MQKVVALGAVVAVAAALAAYAILISMQPAGAYTIGIGVEFNTHATPIWIALHEDLFSKYSINLSTVLKFQTGLELAAALARGDVQAGWVCLGPALVMIDKRVPAKIVAKVHNHGYAIVVNPEKIDDVGDLNGKVIYSPGKGSPAYLLLLKVEDVYGIKFSEIKFMKPEAILNALLSGEIDAAALPEHRVSVAESKGLRVLLRSQDVWPNMPGSYLVVRDSLLEEEPEIVAKLIEITKYGISKINEDPEYAAEVAAEALSVTLPIASKSVSMLDFNTTLDINEIQQYIDFMYEHGILSQRLDAEKIVAYVPGG